MKTVRKICPPKIDCWAYENGGCKILTETVCERSLKCGHYKTQAQFDADEKEKLHKQLALSDTKSAQAMVYVQAIQDNFNSLFSLISDMETEQQNKFKGAVLKLTNAMKEKAES